MNRYSATTILLATLSFSLAGTAFAQQTFQFAPSRETTSVEQKQPVAASSELTLVTTLEEKIVANIPQSIKDRANQFDSTRVAYAKKYEELRDTSKAKSAVSVKTEGSKIEASVNAAPKAGYYMYAALAFFFGYRFVFYGAILLVIFFILRLIFRHFNMIV